MEISNTFKTYCDFLATGDNKKKIKFLSNYSDEDEVCDLFYDGYNDQIIFQKGMEKKIWTSCDFDDVLDDLDQIQAQIDYSYEKLN